MMNEKWNDYRDGETVRAVAPQRPSSTVWESSKKVQLTKDLHLWSQRGVAMNSGLIKRESAYVNESRLWRCVIIERTKEKSVGLADFFCRRSKQRVVAAILSAQLIQGWGSALFGDTQSSPTSGH